MPHINAAVVGKVGVHAAVGRKQEIVELIVLEIIIHDLPGGLFHIYSIRRIGQDQICLLPVHQAGVDFLAGTVAADDAVLPE